MKHTVLGVTTFTALAFFATTPVLATSGTWNVGSGGDWATSGNWASGTIPGAAGSTSGANTDVATFGGSSSSTVAGTTYTISDTTTSTRALGGFNFGSKGNFLIGGSTSSTLYFSDYTTNGNVAAVNEASTSSNVSHTIASNIVTAGAAAAGSSNFRIATLNGFTGTLTLSGNITTNASATGSNVNNIRVVTSGAVNGSSNLSNIVLLSGIISDGTNAKINVSHARDGILELNNANTYSGGFIQGASDGANTITRIGISSVGSASTSNLASGAFGTGTLTLDSGELSSMSTTAYTIGNAVAFTAATTIGTTSAPLILGDSNASYNGALTFTGPVALNASKTTSLTINSSVTMSGVLSGSSAALTKLGAGTLTLSNASNSYNGATTVNAGVLQVDGSLASGSAVGVGGATATGTPTLTGAGTVSGAVTLNAAGGGVAGTINPGTVGGTGTLTVGSITFNTGTTFAVDLTSSASDKLTISGAATFGATPNITFTGSTGATTTTGVGNYVLATIGTGSNLTTGAFSGTAPTYYRLLGTGTQLNLTHQATIGTITATPTATDIITGGTTTFGVTVSNTAPTGSSSLSAGATSGSNTTGSITAGAITAAAGSTSSSASGLTFNGTSVGAGQTGSFTVSDPNADNTPQTGSVTVNVHGHASGNLSGTTLSLGNVHAGYTSAVTSSNSVNASNASGYLVNLKGSATPSGGVSLTSVSGVAAGGTSGAITATLATGQGVGAISTPLTYTFGDDSTLSGASSNVGTTAVTVSGQVYSGTSTWVTNGSGAWGTLNGTGAETFGANWGLNQGSPGLDPSFKGVDTATFGAQAVSSATVNLNNASPNVNSVTFGSPVTAYTIATGSGTTTGLTLSGTTPSINLTGNATTGTQAISTSVNLGANTTVNVGSKQTLNLSGLISETGGSRSLAYTGAGKTVATADNTYTGGTTISGTTFINNGGGATYSAPISSVNRTITATNTTGSGTGSGAVTVQSGGTLAGIGTIKSTSGGITIQNGGTLQSGGIQSGTTAGVGLTINNAAGLTNALTVNGGATLSFSLGSTTNGGGSGAFNFSAPNTNSTYLSLTGTTVDQIFSNTSTAVKINLVDLTVGSPSLSLTLTHQNPYLLIQTELGGNGDFANLWTTGGLGQNGYVLGISDGTMSGYTGFNINTYDINGNNLSATSYYGGLQLYLQNGDILVVPEPGTLAFMLGGLGVLVLWQRRKSTR